jgi:hypothetical protein
MTMKDQKCPDILTIQAVIDGEEQDKIVISHVHSCSLCSEAYHDLAQAVVFAGNLGGEEKLPADFYKTLSSQLGEKTLPAALAAAAIFCLVLFSANLLNPGYLEWWLSVGMTYQFSIFIDTFINLVFFSRELGPLWLIAVLATLVAVEVLILSKVKILEGENHV